MTIEFAGNQEIVQEARKHLDQPAWDFLVGGSESETALRRNRLAFDRLGFRPRVLVDVRNVDPSTTFLGHKLRIPVVLAPVGSLQRFAPEGAVAAAKAADQFGIGQVVSSATLPQLEDTAKTGKHLKVFQLYIRDDWPWVEDMVHRMKKAGYTALCLTVDTARASRRERPILGRSSLALVSGPGAGREYGAAMTWESMGRLKKMAGLPFMLKGIATAEDAKLAVEHGVDVIWVSNHGGRQLDHSLGTMDTLPEIVEAVDGKADIMLDGGVNRGTDVLKAIALGVKAVAIGRMQGYGLAAAGPAGLVRVLEIMEDEIVSAMGLLGVTRVDQITSAYVRRTDPVLMPHEMSAWVNIPEGRIQ